MAFCSFSHYCEYITCTLTPCAYFAHLGTELQPQDSFGEFNKICLDLQKVQEIIRKHHQTFLQLFGMTYCNVILPYGKLSLCT